MATKTNIQIPPMTDEESARGLAALEAMRRHREEDRVAGRVYQPAGELIDEIRAEEEEKFNSECS